jgi:hypothetical protein
MLEHRHPGAVEQCLDARFGAGSESGRDDGGGLSAASAAHERQRCRVLEAGDEDRPGPYRAVSASKRIDGRDICGEQHRAVEEDGDDGVRAWVLSASSSLPPPPPPEFESTQVINDAASGLVIACLRHRNRRSNSRILPRQPRQLMYQRAHIRRAALAEIVEQAVQFRAAMSSIDQPQILVAAFSTAAPALCRARAVEVSWSQP